MISIILYGRNDAHGYNLHKRGAISLNCMAEMLTSPGDEIVFVDYNSPDDFATFPEAIADTLTKRAKELLRVLRVRPSQHSRFRDRTDLAALEPIARNVGLRRSNPENRWILSTNTDMVFVPRRGASLSEIASALPDAYYQLPRFELPEPLWESFDRLDPKGIIAQLDRWGRDFHLNEIVYIPYPHIKYSAPGDFQMFLRSDGWRIDGFHESMLLGWHVDSNLSARLALLPREIGDLVDDFFGYHCDHTRQITAVHRMRDVRNDVHEFVDNVKRADIPEQANSWGLAGEYVEEVALDGTTRTYVDGLKAAIPIPLDQPTEFTCAPHLFAPREYSVDHVLPFLMAAFSSFPKDAVIGWFGVDPSLMSRFANLWTGMGFTESILVFDEHRWLGLQAPPRCMWASADILDKQSKAFVFDFGPGGAEAERNGALGDRAERVMEALRRMVWLEARRLQRRDEAPRLFLGVNTIVNLEVYREYNERIDAVVTAAGTRLQQGFTTEAARGSQGLSEVDCTPMLLVGTAGEVGRQPGFRRRVIRARPEHPGVVAYGPYIALTPGRYEALFEFFGNNVARGSPIKMDVALGRGERVLASGSIKPRAGTFYGVVPFEVEDKGVPTDDVFEFRVWSPGSIDILLTGLRVCRSIGDAKTQQ